MNKFKKLLLSFLVVFTFFSSTQVVRAEEGFDIDTYDVQIVVDEDGTYHVTETLDVTFKERLHGIYINIPTKYENVRWTVDGKTIVRDYTFPITDVKILSNQEASIDSQENGKSIRLGSSDSYAAENETYKISYVIHTKDLGLGGIQTFYQNIITGGWDTNINHVTFKITMPKEFDASKLYFYTEGTTADEFLSYQVNGNVIEGSYNTTVKRGNAITMKLDLPNDYFEFPTFAGWYYLAAGVSALLLVIAIYLFYKYGKDDQVVQTVEFKAPDDLTSADVGFIIDGVVDDRDVVSLIFDWANRGYLTIEEKGNDLIFKRLKNLDENSRLYERNFFDGIFKAGDEISSSSLAGSIFEDFNNSKASLKDFFNLKKNRIYTKNSLLLRALVAFMAAIPLAIFIGTIFYSMYYSGFAILMSASIVIVVMLTGTVLQNIAVQRWHDNSSSKYGLLAGGIAMIGLCYVTAVLLVMGLEIDQMVTLIVVLVITTALCVISNFMLKRTNKGVKYLGQILGLKEFIQVAEKDRLEMLVQDDPQYFYHILPYAYALGLSDVWSKHFKDFKLEPPTWYVGANSPIFNYYMVNSMLNSMDVVQKAIPPVSSSKGGGSFGGGFGGGGFSGGGFGGSSGGGW